MTDHATAAVKRGATLEMWRRGAKTRAIARELGYPNEGYVRSVVSEARRRGDKRAVLRQSGRPRRANDIEAIR